MLPDNSLSIVPVTSAFSTPLRKDSYIDFEWGGKDIQNVTEGLQYRIWSSFYNGETVEITNGESTYTILTKVDVTYHSFAFDQNMQPCLVYVHAGITYLWYYDAVAMGHITKTLGVGLEYPQISLDEHRTSRINVSDVILSYVREDKLYYRMQRDRYGVEYFLLDTPNQRLTQTGMTKNMRFRWRYVYKTQGE